MNGGEALLLALAICYCNDVYREAAKHDIVVKQVEVQVDGEHNGTEGQVMESLSYHVSIDADAPQDVIEQMLRKTDTLAEIHNTLRQGTPVVLGKLNINGKSID